MRSSCRLGLRDCLPQPPPCQAGDVDRDDDRRRQADEEQHQPRRPALDVPGGDVGQLLHGRAEVDVHHRAGQHADPGGEDVVAEADLGQAERVVEQREREERGEPRQQDDLEAAGGHGLIEGAEPAVAGQPLLDQAAGQGAPQPEGEAGACDAAQRDDGRADDDPEEGAGGEGDD